MDNRWITIWIMFIPVFFYGQTYQISLEQVLNEWSLSAPEAKKIKLSYENKIMEFENYKKEFLPSIAFSLNPVNFNHSQKLMQNSENGNYSYVEDFSNSGNMAISIHQKIGFLGGELDISSRLNYLRQFSNNKNRFGTTPLCVSYSQPFIGGACNYRMQKAIQYALYDNVLKQYCSEIADIQMQSANLFMNLFLAKLSAELSLKNLQISDTLLITSKALFDNGHFTKYEYHQMELQKLNNKYIYENSVKRYHKVLRKLIVFLDKEEWIGKKIEVLDPQLNLPLRIDEVMAILYARQNSPFALSQKEKKLRAEQILLEVRLKSRLNGSINISYGLNQYADDFASSYKKFDHVQGIMIGIQVPVFQWGINRNIMKIAKNNYQSAMVDIKQAEANFDNQIRDLVEDYNQNINLWLIAMESYKLSQEQYFFLIQKFYYGKISVYDLALAQQEQYDTMQRYYKAIYNVWNDICILRKATLYDFCENIDLKDLFPNIIK